MFPGFAIAGAIPGIVIMMIVDRADAKRPEPRWALRRVALAGALSIIPAYFLELALTAIGPRGGFVGAAFSGFIVAGCVEEGCKALCVRWFVWNRPEFDERTDGIVYGIRAGLGFAIVENVMYLLGTDSMELLVIVFCVRAVLSVPIHAFEGAIIGHCAAWRRFEGSGPGMFGGWVLAVLLHGSFDTALFSMLLFLRSHDYALAGFMGLVALAAVGVGAVTVRRWWRRALDADDRASVRAAALG